jgi:hypothetical protein
LQASQFSKITPSHLFDCALKLSRCRTIDRQDLTIGGDQQHAFRQLVCQ